MDKKHEVYNKNLKGYTPELFFKGNGAKSYVEYEVSSVEVAEEGILIKCV